MTDVAVVDLGISNVKSVTKAIEFIGKQASLVSSPKEIKEAKKIILPGVGSFDEAISRLIKLDLIDALNEKALIQKIPILGICLGYQLMSKGSEEGTKPGLSWVDSETISIKKFIDNKEYKSPHMGWNQVDWNEEKEHKVLSKKVRLPSRFYFVHSYIPLFKNRDIVIGTTTYGKELDVCFNSENLYGTQFHPEKSHVYGLQLLKNFCAIE
tara:strand:- start:115 stop:747 length:633 start_codon:yes stop_codon:yes gene_type:complete